MKKLLLTLFAGALFTIGAMAQIQEDTTATDNNLTDMQPAGEADRPGEDVERGREDARDSVQQGTERTSGGIQEGVQPREESNDAIERNADKTQPEFKEGIDNNEGSIRSGSDETERKSEAPENTEDAIEKGTSSLNTAPPPVSEAEAAQMRVATGPEIEVVESREGPMNEVVYKYKGEMFYVDRNNNSIVKVEDGDLNDIGENRIVHKKEKTSKRK